MTTASDVDRAALTQELTALVTALWYDIDHNRGRSASTFFTADADLMFSARSFRGTAEIDEVYAGRAARGARVSRHVVTNLHVVAADAERVTAVSVLVLFAEDGEAPRPTTAPALVADVTDEFVRVDGRLRIASRRIDHAFIAPTTVLAVPTS